MKTFLKFFIPIILFLLIVFPPHCNQAQAALAPKCGENSIFETINMIRNSGKGGENIVDDPYALFSIMGCVIAQLTTYLLGLANIIAAIMIMISGLKYMTSSGNPSAQQSAIKSLNASVIGFLILLCFWSLFALLKTLLRVPG